MVYTIPSITEIISLNVDFSVSSCFIYFNSSGDGGNRTRVRKNRPSNIYEHRPSDFSPVQRGTDKSLTSQPFGPESPLSCDPWLIARHSDFLSPGTTTGQRAGWADVAYKEAIELALAVLGGEGHRCVGSVIGT